MVNIEFSNETKEKVDEELLEDLINYASKYLKLGNIELGVIFVDNKYIHKLNKEYRNIDRETDVITFRLADYEPVIVGDTLVLGDTYISLEKAHSQAIEYGHSFKRELAFLLVHGFLHLLGYDHMTKEDEIEMFTLQEEILDSYGIKRESKDN